MKPPKGPIAADELELRDLRQPLDTAAPVEFDAATAYVAALRATEAKLRGLFESNVVNITFSNDNGQVFEANDAFLAMVGKTRAELEAGQIDWRALTAPEYLEINERAHDEARRYGKSRPFEKQYLRADGTRVWVLVSLARLPGSNGETTALSIDITAMKETEQALVASERKFSTVFANSPLAMYIADITTARIADTNDAFTQLTGYTREQVLGRTTLELGLWEEPQLRAKSLELLNHGPVRNVDAVFTRQSGERRRVLVSADRLGSSSGGADQYVTVVADLTDHFVLEEQFRQAQKMEAVGRLAGGVAHDFNNLLTVISGFSEFVLEHPDLPGETRSHVEEIRRAAASAAGLTRQLLTFSRRQTIQPRVMDLNQSVRQADALLRRLVGEDVEIDLKLAPRVAPVRADPGQIEQVIVNLVVNARDAMPKGGSLTIETADVILDDAFVALHPDAQAGPHVVMSVRDTGVGMDDAVKARLFEPFFTTKEAGKGTGLGLATIYGIVKQAGGSISVTSEVGRGTTFRVYLPATGPLAATATTAEEPLIGGTETVLVVEDQSDVRMLVTGVLKRYGYTVIAAATPAAGLDVVTSGRHIDLLLTDVVMPKTSGRELAQMVTKARPGVPVLYMSGYTDEAVREHGVLTRELQLLQKPFTTRTLLRRVREALDTKA